jgi:cytochrome c oxidase subunit 4
MTVREASLTYIALMVLLAITVGSSFFSLGPGNGLINFGVALAKAMLIGLVFMHLRRSGLLISLTVAAALFWLAILFGMALIDFVSR